MVIFHKFFVEFGVNSCFIRDYPAGLPIWEKATLRYQSKEGTANLQGLLYMVSLCMMEVEVLTEHGYEIEELGSFIMLSREAADWVNTIQAVAVLVYGSAKNEVSDCRHCNIQFSKWNHL